MFYYKNAAMLQLDKMGIDIPMLDGRLIAMKDFLKDSGAKITQLTNSGFTLEELKPYLDKEYYESLDTNPDKEIIKAFELIDRNGNYNRYDPSKAVISMRGLFTKTIFTY